MFVRQIRDPHLAQNAYLIGCSLTREALLIDPGRDLDRYVLPAEAAGLRIFGVAETHVHADFLSGARELADRYVAKLYLSGEGPGENYSWLSEGRYEYELLTDGASFHIGQLEIHALHTPGHTPEHLCFLVFDRASATTDPVAIVSGDCVLIGDVGRPELEAESDGARREAASALYRSLLRFMELPDFLQVWPAHDHDRSESKTSTVGYERRTNRGLLAALRGEEALVETLLEEPVEQLRYFSRLRHLNRNDPPPLGPLPTPRPLTARELESLLHLPSVVVLEACRSRTEFLLGHLPGTLFTPLGESFPRLVGSLIEPDERIYLLIAPTRIEEAVRDLVRIGLDRICGYITPDTLCEYLETEGSDLRSQVVSFPVSGKPSQHRKSARPVYRRRAPG